MAFRLRNANPHLWLLPTNKKPPRLPEENLLRFAFSITYTKSEASRARREVRHFFARRYTRILSFLKTSFTIASGDGENPDISSTGSVATFLHFQKRCLEIFNHLEKKVNRADALLKTMPGYFLWAPAK